jgi:two-component system, cell cycle response regulator
MPVKILSVDDSDTIRMIVRRTLGSYAVIVLEARNGEEGLAVATAEKPDLILLDITMPVMDGITMLTRLKENAGLKTIPVVMLTAESGRENVANLTRLGVCEYLVKPFRDDQLIEKLGRVLPLKRKVP